MVPRYTRPEMAAIWAPANRFRIWFEIEALAAEAMAELGTIPVRPPAPSARRAARRPPRSARRTSTAIDAIERETRHDVIAFLTWLGRRVGAEDAASCIWA